MNTQITMVKAQSRKLVIFAVAAAFIFSLAMLAPFSGSALASSQGGFNKAGGGYSGPGPALVTVEQAKNMSDDAYVTLKGYIVQSLGGEKYLFKDSSGVVNVDIDHKRWQGLNVGPEDMVEIHGEVDKDWFETEIDVKRISKP